MKKRQDKTNAVRAMRRLARKNHAATLAGWPSWSAFETAVINDKVTIPIKPHEEG